MPDGERKTLNGRADALPEERPAVGARPLSVGCAARTEAFTDPAWCTWRTLRKSTAANGCFRPDAALSAINTVVCPPLLPSAINTVVCPPLLPRSLSAGIRGNRYRSLLRGPSDNFHATMNANIALIVSIRVEQNPPNKKRQPAAQDRWRTRHACLPHLGQVIRSLQGGCHVSRPFGRLSRTARFPSGICTTGPDANRCSRWRIRRIHPQPSSPGLFIRAARVFPVTG